MTGVDAGSDDPQDGAGSPLDALAHDLQELRRAAGSPSYAELVQRITRLRTDRGAAAVEARPARTTVYDAFRTGRRRLDVTLLEDVVRVLGVPEHEVPDWSRRCRAAQQALRAPRTPDPAPAPALDPATAPVPEPRPGGRRRPAAWVVALIASCVAVNLGGRTLVEVLDVALHLDMVGTAAAAIVLGPWWGALVGLLTNVGGATVSGSTSLPFALVNVVGALVWGYGVRRWGLGRSLPRFFLLNVLVAVACTATAAPILVLLFDGYTSNASNGVTTTLIALGAPLVASVVASNLLTSLVDKTISGFLALVVAEVLPDASPLHGPGPDRAPAPASVTTSLGRHGPGRLDPRGRRAPGRRGPG